MSKIMQEINLIYKSKFGFPKLTFIIFYRRAFLRMSVRVIVVLVTYLFILRFDTI